VCCSHNITLYSLRYVNAGAIELEPQHNGQIQVYQKSIEEMKHILEMFPSNCSCACQHPHHHTLVDSKNLYYSKLVDCDPLGQQTSTIGLRPFHLKIYSPDHYLIPDHYQILVQVRQIREYT
jgi:hypothetical protein